MQRDFFKARKQSQKNTKYYFKNADMEIKRSNLRTLEVLSITLMVAIIVFSILTMRILDGWGPSTYHYAFAVVIAIYVVVSIYLNYRVPKGSLVVKVICAIFVITFMVFLCILDTIPSPGTSQIFVGLFLVAAPIVFVVPFIEVVCFQVGTLILFMVMAFHFKQINIVYTDFLATILSFAMSIVIYWIVMNIRVEEFMQKNAYKISSEVDNLTGISNRFYCEEKINWLLAERMPDSPCAMLVIDVDDFKKINDTLGHYKGDEVLKAVAAILSGVFRKTDVVGRYGGDEFLIFMPDFSDSSIIEEKCLTIADEVKLVLDSSFDTSCSIGVCILENGDATLENMFKVADEALYEAKSFNKGTYLIHKYENAKK